MVPEKGENEKEYVPLTPDEQRSDRIYQMLRDVEITKATQIIGPGPFYCCFCGTKMEESGHMMSKFYLCPNAGEFTWSPPGWERVEIDGTSYVTVGLNSSNEELERERGYYAMCAEAHKRAAELQKQDDIKRGKASEELREANERRAGRAR